MPTDFGLFLFLRNGSPRGADLRLTSGIGGTTSAFQFSPPRSASAAPNALIADGECIRLYEILQSTAQRQNTSHPRAGRGAYVGLLCQLHPRRFQRKASEQLQLHSFAPSPLKRTTNLILYSFLSFLLHGNNRFDRTLRSKKKKNRHPSQFSESNFSNLLPLFSPLTSESCRYQRYVCKYASGTIFGHRHGEL